MDNLKYIINEMEKHREDFNKTIQKISTQDIERLNEIQVDTDEFNEMVKKYKKLHIQSKRT